MENKHEELMTDEFESELEQEDSKSNIKVYLFLFLATLLLAALLYKFIDNNQKATQKPNVKKIDNVILEKKFTIPTPQEKEVVKTKVTELPLLPSETKKIKTLKPRIIKNTSFILKFNENIKKDTPSQTNQEVIHKESEHLLSDKKNKPYTGGISSVAGINKYNPNLYLARGTYIGCSLKTKLVSAVSGQIACTVTSDIYSVSGNVLLVDKGSTIVGKYKSGNLKFGVERHYVIWDEIRTPNNVMINVSSGATDELGAGGIHGEVDYNWGMRIGSALLVSLIDDALSATASNISKNGRTNYLISTSDNTKTMSERVLDKFINIPAVLYKNHGDIVGVYVNKDIDFSQVYKLKRRTK